MNVAAKINSEYRLMARPIRKFGDLDSALKLLLKGCNVTPLLLTSLSAHIYDNLYTEDCKVIDLLTDYNKRVKNKSSTWGDIRRANEINRINVRIDDIVYQYNKTVI